MQTDLQSHSIVAGLWQLGVGLCRGMCDGCGVLWQLGVGLCRGMCDGCGVLWQLGVGLCRGMCDGCGVLWQLGVGLCRGMCDGCGVLLLVALYSLHMHSCCLQTKSVQRRLHGSSGSSSLSWKHCRGALQLFYLDLGRMYVHRSKFVNTVEPLYSGHH